MTNPDYPAFRRILDACVDEDDSTATVIERADGPNAYILPQSLYEELTRKASAYDQEHGVNKSQADLVEEQALKGLLEGRSS